MTTALFANNAVSTLAATLNLADLSCTVETGHGARFPSPGAQQCFYATIQQGTLYEIVKVTARSGDTFTLVRAQDGTAAQTWSSGASIDLRAPKVVLDLFLQKDDAASLYAPKTGPIELAAAPTLDAHATRKDYVDDSVAALESALQPQITAALLIGEIKDWPGLDLPSGFLWCDGAAISRTTYANLFDALTRTLTVTLTLGSTTATVTSGSTADLNGMPVSGTGVPAGTTIVSGEGTSTLVLSQAAIVTQAGASLRVCPHGSGNGSTTFNVPDRRGVAAFGRDNMGGSAASRLTAGVSGLDGERLGVLGGDQRTPQHNHTASSAPHTHTGNTNSDGSHSHNVPNTGVLIGGAYSAGSGAYAANATTTTSTPGTHSHAFTTDATAATVTVDNAGAGTAQNVPPAAVTNFIIYAGV